MSFTFSPSLRATMSTIVGTLLFVALSSCSGSAQQGVAVVAHRGFHKSEVGQGTRNSIASLRAAQEGGFWGSEFDVNMTADEVVLVHHDGVIDGKLFNDYPASEFADFRLENGETIPTLDEYLTQAEKCSTTVLVLEVKFHKTPEMENRCIEICIDALKEHGLFTPDRVMFISFSMNACKTLVSMAPDFTVQYLHNDRTPDEIFAEGVCGIDTHFRTMLIDTTWVPSARAHGMSVNAWTVNAKQDMEKVLALGVDYITTDYPDLAREVIAEMGLKERVNTTK